MPGSTAKDYSTTRTMDCSLTTLPIQQSTAIQNQSPPNDPIVSPTSNTFQSSQSTVPPISKSSVPRILKYSLPISNSADPEQQQLFQLSDSNIHVEDNAQSVDILASTEQVDPVASVPPNFHFQSSDIPIPNSSDLPILDSPNNPIEPTTLAPQQITVTSRSSRDQFHEPINSTKRSIPISDQLHQSAAVLPNFQFQSSDSPISNSIFNSTDPPTTPILKTQNLRTLPILKSVHFHLQIPIFMVMIMPNPWTSWLPQSKLTLLLQFLQI